MPLNFKNLPRGAATTHKAWVSLLKEEIKNYTHMFSETICPSGLSTSPGGDSRIRVGARLLLQECSYYPEHPHYREIEILETNGDYIKFKDCITDYIGWIDTARLLNRKVWTHSNDGYVIVALLSESKAVETTTDI